MMVAGPNGARHLPQLPQINCYFFIHLVIQKNRRLMMGKLTSCPTKHIIQVELELRFHRNFLKNGDPGRTRTPNLLIRSQLLYPVELQDQLDNKYYILRVLTTKWFGFKFFDFSFQCCAINRLLYMTINAAITPVLAKPN